MRILILTNMFPAPERPAYGIFVKEQTDSLRKAGIAVDILFIKGYKSKWNYLKAIWQLWSKLYTLRIRSAQCKRSTLHTPYDLIHAHYGWSGWVGRLQAGLPLVVTFHGDDLLGIPKEVNPDFECTFFSRIIVCLNKILIRLSDASIVQSAEMKLKSGNPQTTIIPCGVNFQTFKTMDQSTARKQLNLDIRKKYILFAADPSVPQKNFPLAQKVFNLIKETYPETELLAVFNQPYEKMPLYMNACDVLLFTSILEGAGIVVKEAMACNLPVVSVAVGDVRMVIDKTHNCFVTSPVPQEMAKRIKQIFDSRQRSNGRGKIEHLEINNIARQIIKCYKNAV